VRVTLDFERADTEALRALSQQTGESASALIREAVRRLIRRKRSQQ
jgi:predicted DNA-binding protein